MARARLTMLLLSVAAGTALVLGLVGIYGVLAYAVNQRRSEFSVRIALGATPGSVSRMVLRQGTVLALLGISAGLPASWVLGDLLSTVLYGMSPRDPIAIGGMAALLLGVALAASYFPARLGASVDPARVLRGE